MFFDRVAFPTECFGPPLRRFLHFGIIRRCLLRSADQNIANSTTNPGMPVVGEDHVDHFVMRLALAGGIATLDIEIGEVFAGEISFYSQALYEFGVDDW